jgi:hypothetical protein
LQLHAIAKIIFRKAAGMPVASVQRRCAYNTVLAQHSQQLQAWRGATVPALICATVPALLCRFEHPEVWDMRPKKQHPCYTTSSNDYGAKPPTGFDMPLVWTGIHGKFTNTFNGGCYRSMGLKTSVERSRVHRELDYL